MTTDYHPKFPDKTNISYELTTYDQVSGSPSKMKYKFGSENRFPSVKKNICPQNAYDLPSMKMTRGAGFGIGDRFVEIGKRKNPSPDTYKINSLFNPNATTSTFTNHMKKNTYSFGTGRESFSSTVVNTPKPYYIGSDRKNPGPQEYDPQKPIGHEAVAFKLKYKIDYHDPAKMARKQSIPGPGTYEDTTSLNPTGNYNTSDFVNSKASRWGKDEKLKMPNDTFYHNPGPGYHESLGNIGDNFGFQTASQFHTIQTRQFAKADKPNWNTMYMGVHKTPVFNPGPGTYVPPSDFGYVTMSPVQVNNRHVRVNRDQQTQNIYKQKITNTLKGKRRSVNPISVNNIIGQAEQLNSHMSSQPITSPAREQKKFNAWKTLQDFSPAAARRNRNATGGLLTLNQTTNLKLSPIGGISNQIMRDEMSKTPTYRTDIPLNNKNVNSMMLTKGSGGELNGQVISQKMVQIIENNDSMGKQTNVSDFEHKMGLDKSTTVGGRSSYEEMVNNQNFMAQAKQIFDKEDASL